MVASFSASGFFVQTPWGPRKSGIPDSVEMPAPVSATIRRAAGGGDPAPDGVDDPVGGLHYWGTSHPADLSTASGLWPPSPTHRGKGGVGFPNLSHAFTSASPVAGRARRACHPPGG